MKLLLVGIIGLALINLGAERRGTPTLSVSNVAASTQVGARMRVRVGTFGARVMGPMVRSTLQETRESLHELGPAINRAKPHEIQRARAFERKIAALDSAALNSLDRGHPILAMKQALGGKQFLTVVKQTVFEETVF